MAIDSKKKLDNVLAQLEAWQGDGVQSVVVASNRSARVDDVEGRKITVKVTVRDELSTDWLAVRLTRWMTDSLKATLIERSPTVNGDDVSAWEATYFAPITLGDDEPPKAKSPASSVSPSKPAAAPSPTADSSLNASSTKS